MESSVSVRLHFDEKTGEYTCPRNPSHKFKLDADGWLVSL